MYIKLDTRKSPLDHSIAALLGQVVIGPGMRDDLIHLLVMPLPIFLFFRLRYLSISLTQFPMPSSLLPPPSALLPPSEPVQRGV